MAVVLKTVHIRPHVGKAKMKMGLRGGRFFLKNCKQTAEKCKQIWIIFNRNAL